MKFRYFSVQLWLLLEMWVSIFLLDFVFSPNQVILMSFVASLPIRMYSPEAIVCPDILLVCLLSRILLLSSWG